MSDPGIDIGYGGKNGLEIRSVFAWRTAGGDAVHRYVWRYRCPAFRSESTSSFRTEAGARKDFENCMFAVKVLED